MHLPQAIRDALAWTFPKAWLRFQLAQRATDEVEADYLDCMVNPVRAAIDVGAHVGKYSYPLSALAPKVYALEANPALARKIRRALPKNVKVLTCAASSRAGRVELHIPDGGRSVGLAGIDADVATRGGSSISISIDAVTLDSVTAEPIGFIKIDVEGHELEVLRGATRLLSQDRPTVLVETVERFRPNAVQDLAAFFRHHDYVGLFIRGGEVWPVSSFRKEFQETPSPCGLAPPVYNFIFAPSDRAASLMEKIRRTVRKA